jgi:hypothetical protein
MRRAQQLLEFYDEENYIIPPNRMYRGDEYKVKDQAELDPAHMLQGPTSGYSYNRNTQAGPGPLYPDGKKPNKKADLAK